MSSDGLLTRIAIESLRTAARSPAAPRRPAARDPAARLALLEAILLRDEATAAHRARLRKKPPGRTMLL